MEAYIDAYIDAVQPSLVVSLFDNDLRFLELRSRHPGIRTLFIQNGWRSYHADVFESLSSLSLNRRQSLLVDYMLVFGRGVGREYLRYISGQAITIGSLKNNHCRRTAHPSMDTLAFISQFNEGGVNIHGKSVPHDVFFRRVDELVLSCLAEYARDRGKHLLVIPRFRDQTSGERVREDAYYRTMLGSECRFLEPEGNFPSYEAVDRAGVSVGIDTTLAYESIARGNRTVIFSIRSEMMKIKGLTFGWPADYPATGFFWTNLPRRDLFFEILDRAFGASRDQWEAAVSAAGFDSLMTYDAGNETLKSILARDSGAT
jgi:surface carbohydrate biosynthesis protein